MLGEEASGLDADGAAPLDMLAGALDAGPHAESASVEAKAMLGMDKREYRFFTLLRSLLMRMVCNNGCATGSSVF